MIVKVRFRVIAENYKREASVVYNDGFLNLSLITSVSIMGSEARIIFGDHQNFCSLDTDEWYAIYKKFLSGNIPLEQNY